MHASAAEVQDSASILKRPSSVALLLANLIPLLGVVFFRWEVFPLILLFWFENVIVGAINILKMIVARGGAPVGHAAKFFMIPFFTVHYGIFTFVHGMFVLVIFGGLQGANRDPFSMLNGPDSIWHLLVSQGMHWAALGLAISHFVSFYFDYVQSGAYRTAAVTTLMIAPYGRIVVLHLTILIGGALVMALGSPTVGLVLLVLLKTAFDWRSLRKSAALAKLPAPEAVQRF